MTLLNEDVTCHESRDQSSTRLQVLMWGWSVKQIVNFVRKVEYFAEGILVEGPYSQASSQRVKVGSAATQTVRRYRRFQNKKITYFISIQTINKHGFLSNPDNLRNLYRHLSHSLIHQASRAMEAASITAQSASREDGKKWKIEGL